MVATFTLGPNGQPVAAGAAGIAATPTVPTATPKPQLPATTASAAPQLPAVLQDNTTAAAIWAAANESMVIDLETGRPSRYLGWMNKPDADVQMVLPGIALGAPYLCLAGKYVGLAPDFSFIVTRKVEMYARMAADGTYMYAAFPKDAAKFQAKLDSDTTIEKADRRRLLLYPIMVAQIVVFNKGEVIPVTVTADMKKLEPFKRVVEEQNKSTQPEWIAGDALKAAIAGSMPIKFRVVGGMTMVGDKNAFGSYFLAKAVVRVITQAEAVALVNWMAAGSVGQEESDEAYDWRLSTLEKALVK